MTSSEKEHVVTIDKLPVSARIGPGQIDSYLNKHTIVTHSVFDKGESSYGRMSLLLLPLWLLCNWSEEKLWG